MHFRKLVFFFSILFCTVVTQALAQLPGFEIVDITNDIHRNQNAGGLNGCGEVAFSKRFNDVGDAEEIFVYDNGQTVRITDDNVNDRLVDINDAGTLAWSRNVASSPTAFEIAVFENGEMFLLTDDDVIDNAPKMNNLGHITWPRGASGLDRDIMLYDGETIRQISPDDDLTDAFPVINDNDAIGWTRFDFGEVPFTTEPMLYVDGETIEMTDGSFLQAAINDINNAGVVVWQSEDTETFEWRIHVWENGKSTMLTDDGHLPEINNLGDISFSRAGADGFLKTWVYSAGTFTQVTDEPFHMGPTAINDWGEMVLSWVVAFPTVNLRIMRRIRTGEADFDGHIDLRDFAAFQNCITGPGDFDGTEGGFDRLCDCRFLDIDHDRDVDADDFALFQPAMDGPL